MRAVRLLPSFRTQVIQAELKSILARQLRRDYGPRFQVAHFSIQVNHLHLLVEAQAPTAEEIAASPRLVSKRAAKGLDTKERDMLRRGIAGLAISFARAVNRILGRTGAVWADRHHRSELESPSKVRNALVYVLQNFRRHGALAFGVGTVDPFSTSTGFDGWAEPHTTWEEAEPWRPEPRTWLLAVGWQRAGGKLSTLIAPPLAPDTTPPSYRPYAVTRGRQPGAPPA